MNKIPAPFTVESKIYKDPQSNNPNEPSQRIIKVIITLNNQNSNDNTKDDLNSNLNCDISTKNTVKPILSISSSYVRESPPHNSQKNPSILQQKPNLVEQITQFEEKISPEDLSYDIQSPQKRSLGPPTFSSPRYKRSYNVDANESIENENDNLDSDDNASFSIKKNKFDQRKKKTNIFSRTSKTVNQNPQASSISKEKITNSQYQENFDSNQLKKDDKNQYSYLRTQQVNSKKFSQNTFRKQSPKRSFKQERYFEEEPDNIVDEIPKVPIIFRKNKPYKSSIKNRPYFSTSTILVDNQRKEKVEKHQKLEKNDKKLNRRILRIPTVNDDLPIFHEDIPDAFNNKKDIYQNHQMLLVEEEEDIQDDDENVISFAPLANLQPNNDNIRRKTEFSNNSPQILKEPVQLPNSALNNLSQIKTDTNNDIEDLNEEEDLLVSDDDDDDYVNEIMKFDKFENGSNKTSHTNIINHTNENDKLAKYKIDDLNENEHDDINPLIENNILNKRTNSIIPPNEINTNFEKTYQQRNRFSKIENQLIFEENPEEEFDQNKITSPPNLTNRQTRLTFNNQDTLSIQSTIKPQVKENQIQYHKPDNEKIINITFDDLLPSENLINTENSHETFDQTQTVINSPTKNEVTANFSPIKKVENEGLLNNDTNQLSSIITKESEDKKDENYWMFIPVDKKKRKKETNITQNMSKVVNVSRNFVKGVQAFRSLSMLLNQHRYEHFIMNLDKENQNLIGIYTLNDRMSQIKKIWGDGPEKATLDDVNSSLIYNPSSKKFSNLDPSFRQDVDAVYLK